MNRIPAPNHRPTPRSPRSPFAWIPGWLLVLATATSQAAPNPLADVLHRPGLKPAAFAKPGAAPSDLPAGLATPDAPALVQEVNWMAHRIAEGCTNPAINSDRLADAAIFHKAILWALRYETNLTLSDLDLVKRAAVRGRARLEALDSGTPAWTTRKGAVVRGYVSAVDGSVQPYGVIVPSGYDPSRPMRLDVVLHGSSRPVGMSELRFASRFNPDDAAQPAPDVPYIELHPLGRVENCYRWAGETDVFEAIEAVGRNYHIDRDRIVLRGMSMGASGTWHLGLKHPDYFVALGPYCGYVDTHRFSETPVPGFIRVGALPAHQERGLHLLDSVDYAANAGVVPVVAAIGDQDIFFQAHVIMAQAMVAEGIDLLNLVSVGTGHVIDPVTHRDQLRRIAIRADAGLDRMPRQMRFVTWSLKYNRCHWLEVLALGEAYARAEFNGRIGADHSIWIDAPRNITRFVLHPPAVSAETTRIVIGGETMAFPRTRPGQTPRPLSFSMTGGRWKCDGAFDAARTSATGPGLQGPIDDAFTAPFVCVRGTGRPWNAAVQAWSEASLRRFAYEWARYLRGDLPIIDDSQLTDELMSSRNVILFGDPGSNRWIRKCLAKLPLHWTREEIRLQGGNWPAGNHAPVLIAPNPLPGGRGHYVVINSGHTFHEAEFAAFNYLLFPRLGDWGVARIQPGGERWSPGAGAFPEEWVRAGFLGR